MIRDCYCVMHKEVSPGMFNLEITVRPEGSTAMAAMVHIDGPFTESKARKLSSEIMDRRRINLAFWKIKIKD